MRGHPHADEVIQDETVEETAEEVLVRETEAVAEAEQRVRRHAAGRQNRGDERQLICGARDVAVRQTLALERRRRQEGSRSCAADETRRQVGVRAKWLDGLALHEGQARRAEM